MLYNFKGLTSFDLETSKVTPRGEDVHAHRPLGVICAGLATSPKDVNLYWGGMNDGPYTYNPQMSKEECQAVVKAMVEMDEAGYPGLTWNGFGFDYVILAEESGMWEECFNLALNHYDMMFQFFCIKGFYMGLAKVERAHGLPGKFDGISGADIPQMWADGQYERCLRYQEQDALQPLELARQVALTGNLLWYTSAQMTAWSPEKQMPKVTKFGSLMTVRDCLGIQEPDTSWMGDQIPRSRFFEQWAAAGLSI